MDFPENDKVYIDSNEYYSGDALPFYMSGERHRLEIVSNGKTMSRDLVLFYADSIPAISIEMENGAFDKMTSDPMHLDKTTSTITIVDPNAQINTSEYCYFGGNGGSSWECDKKSYEISLLRPISFLGMRACEKWTLISNGWTTLT